MVDIQDHFENIIKKKEIVRDKPPIQIYVKRSQNGVQLNL